MFITTTVQLNCDLKALTFSIYTWFSFNTFFIQNNIVFILEQTVFMFLKHFKLIESSPKLNLVQSYINLVLQTILYYVIIYGGLTDSPGQLRASVLVNWDMVTRGGVNLLQQ